MSTHESSRSATRYLHRCGQAYTRTVEAATPSERMIICDHCLEPMPICDEARNRFRYDLYVPQRAAARSAPPPLARATTPSHRMFDLAIWAALAGAAPRPSEPPLR